MSSVSKGKKHAGGREEEQPLLCLPDDVCEGGNVDQVDTADIDIAIYGPDGITRPLDSYSLGASLGNSAQGSIYGSLTSGGEYLPDGDPTGSLRSNISASSFVSTNSDKGATRKPFRYHSPSSGVAGHGQGRSSGASVAGNVYQRYKYYTKLSPHDRQAFTIPNHVLPSKLFVLRPPIGFSRGSSASKVGTQSSLVTILSIWNTMLGTSLLSMPWAIEQAGLVMGLFLVFFMGGLCLYTCHLIVKNDNGNGAHGRELDFGDICGIHLGQWSNYLCVVFSVMTFVGAQVVFWVLMSNFLFHVGECVLNSAYPNSLADATLFNSSISWTSIWNLKTTPLFLLIPLFPLVNLKSLTFFTKFNALGIVGVMYMIFFAIYSIGVNGIHFNSSVELFTPTFPALSGVLSLSFFIHNGVLSITRNAKNPEKNGRDLIIAYICVGLTYMFVGFGIYLSYPGDKSDLKSNFLDNFASDNPVAVIARIFLLLQITTVFPLIMFIIRFQVMQTLFGKAYPSFGHVFALNTIVTAACVLFAIFMPHIGDIIRFTGSFCGVIVVFCLPSLLDYKIKRETRRATSWTFASVVFVMTVGVVNFVLQFFV